MNSNLNERLTENYKTSIKETLEYLKTKGYVVSTDINTEDRYISKYYVDKSDFFKVCWIHETYDILIKPKVKNEFNIPVSQGEILSLILDILPFVEAEDLNDYKVYEKYESEFVDWNILKDELKDYMKLSKNISKDIGEDFSNVANQGKVLTSKLIFYNDEIGTFSERKSYYQYDKKAKRFVKLNSEDIHKILLDYFNISPNSIKEADIKRNMRGTFTDIVINTPLPIKWNNNAKSESILKKYKKPYKKVKKIVDCFN